MLDRIYKCDKNSKIFANSNFGYTRVTIERPLRLRYQMTLEDKARFLDAFPHLLDALQQIDKEIGRKPILYWNEVEKKIQKILKINKSKWKAYEWKQFRDVFTHTAPEAKEVLKGKNEFEADTDLRDFENIPLAQDIDVYFKTEVLPHVPDAWMDRTKDKVGYEINFNSHFFNYPKPRELKVIDKELKSVESEILKLLNQVVE